MGVPRAYLVDYKGCRKRGATIFVLDYLGHNLYKEDVFDYDDKRQGLEIEHEIDVTFNFINYKHTFKLFKAHVVSELYQSQLVKLERNNIYQRPEITIDNYDKFFGYHEWKKILKKIGIIEEEQS